MDTIFALLPTIATVLSVIGSILYIYYNYLSKPIAEMRETVVATATEQRVHAESSKEFRQSVNHKMDVLLEETVSLEGRVSRLESKAASASSNTDFYNGC